MAAADKSVYLVPDGDSICMATYYQAYGAATLSCQTAAQIAAGGTPPEIKGGDGRVNLSNIVPDGVKAVTVNFASASSVATPVQNNVYSVDVALADGPRTVTYDTDAGAVEYPIDLPNSPAQGD